MEKQMMDCTAKKLEDKLVKAGVKLSLLKYYANQQLYWLQPDRGLPQTECEKRICKVWKTVIRKLNG